ncbi:SM-like, degradation of cytoplasmic mRNAs and positively regulates transcription initiation [Cadophora gregata]|uniref:SM-like, degradation of cytoplasmic mRNAs and positively regulates transcription initiation n=1 Tax=Cadophora gregata TaxID=51156 RepID=UPI0026DBD5A0|nr:SM-like, degradation of cytoplasmic mRNAs and positively regulates transcription initiation [Cadophora gregata]KAK0107282.1 SM-like, degradation of cytoplasmic mRNAs and positively regulates transcription initiation [Cadophora gregata]
MENLTLDENNAGGPPQQQQQLLGPSPQNQQLPPQMFTTAAQLLDLTDSKGFSFCLSRTHFSSDHFSLHFSNHHPDTTLTKYTEKLMVALRDGRKLIGVLRSWDQFANLVLQSTIERLFVPPPNSSRTSTPTKPGETAQPGLYADIPRGIFLVRGENVLLLGEIDLDKDDDPPPGYEKAEVELVHRLSKERKAQEAKREKSRLVKLRALGFEGENTTEASI